VANTVGISDHAQVSTNDRWWSLRVNNRWSARAPGSRYGWPKKPSQRYTATRSSSP